LQALPDGNLLCTLSPQQLGELLLMGVNVQGGPGRSRRNVDSIIEHDMEHKRLLYADSSSSSSSNGAAGSTSGSSSTPVQLVEHLIATAMIRSTNLYPWVVPQLTESTAAQQLTPQAITRLMCLCIQLQPPSQRRRATWHGEEDQAPEESSPVLAALLDLPGAQAIQPDSLARLVQLAARCEQYSLAEQVIDAVPAADQLPSRVLCEVLVSAGAARELELVRLLAGLEAAQELAPGDAMWLLQQLVKSHWGEGLDQTLEDLEDMDLGGQLTGGELLQLLQLALKHDSWGSGVEELMQLTPAADQIDNLDGLASFLQALMASDMEYDHLQFICEDFSAVSKLPPDAVAELIRKSVTGKVDCLYPFLVNHPAVSSFSRETLEELLLAVVQRKQQDPECEKHLADVVALLKAPAAAQLSTEVLLLQHAVQEQRHDDRYYSAEKVFLFTFKETEQQLLALPAVQNLPADAAASVLAAAITMGNDAAVSSLCALPAVQQLSKQRASEQYLLALQKGRFRVAVQLQQLLQLPDSQFEQVQLKPEELQKLLLVAIRDGDSEAVGICCQQAASTTATPSAAASRIGDQGMLSVLRDALQHMCHGRINVAAVEQLFALADAQAVSADVVTKLMTACIECRSVEGLQLTGQLPAAAQINQQSAERLVQVAVQQLSRRERSNMHVERSRLLQAVLQLAAVQRLQPAAVARLQVAAYQKKLPL
jgi:hypothetical protein